MRPPFSVYFAALLMMFASTCAKIYKPMSRTTRCANAATAPARAPCAIGPRLLLRRSAKIATTTGAARGLAVEMLFSLLVVMPAYQEVTADSEKLRALVHVLRNEVAPIVNAAYLFRRRVGSDPELGEILTVIERQLSEIVATIDAIAELRNHPSAPSRRIDNDTAPAKRRILVADDNQDLLVSFAAILRDSGHEVKLAADGREALQLAEEWQPEFVVLDVHMPGINGYEIARRLRARFPPEAMRLVMMSGTGLDQATLVGARDAGFDHCVDKLTAVASLDELLRTDAPATAQSG
jgi:CheY-like chemotaxis protein